MITITQEYLKSVFSYNPTTGEFKTIGGSSVGSSHKQGYIVISIKHKMYLAHRLIYLYMVGEWPKLDIDHINGIKSDNRWENLRELNRQGNMENIKKAYNGNKLGILGVRRKGNLYEATITIQGCNKHLGYFNSAEKAHEAYLLAKRKYHSAGTL